MPERWTLERFQIDHAQQAINLTIAKTNRPRSMDDRAAGTIAGTPPHVKSKWAFWHGEDGDRYANVASRFAAIMRRADEKEAVSRRFCFHDLRHWYAVTYLQGGGNINDLQKSSTMVDQDNRRLPYLTPEEAESAKRPAQMSARG